MEPYRVYIDDLVYDLVESGVNTEKLTIDLKSRLLQIPALDVVLDKKASPLLVAMSRTTSSLHNCFVGSNRTLEYPEFE